MTETTPYLWLRKARGGKQIAYHRKHGVARRVHDAEGRNLLPDDAGFAAAFAALDRADAVKASAPERPYSLSTLIAKYQADDHWKRLAPLTREDYGRVFAALAADYGDGDMRMVELPAVHAIRKRFATDKAGKHTPYRANKVVRVMSLLCEFSRTLGWRKDNPCLRPKRLPTGDGYPAWSGAEFDQFMACEHIGEPIKRAAALAFYTGARVGDCIALLRSQRQDGVIDLTPAKTRRTTKARVMIPEHPRLTAVLDAAPVTDAATLLTRADGQPWKIDHIKHAMTKAVQTAGLRPHLSFHGLRKGLSAALAEAGASDSEIDSVIPHADPKMTRLYRKGAEQRRLAVSAIARLP